MIELIEVYGGLHDARAIARDLEAKNMTVLSVTAGVQGGYLITVREPVVPADRLASNLLKGLRLAVMRLARMEPSDNRAVSAEFVALAALSSGDQGSAVMDAIERSLRHAGK